MAEGMAFLVGQSLTCFWIEEDFKGQISHTAIIVRLGWKENEDARLRYFVRVELPRFQMSNFKYDEGSTLPGWAENNDEEIKTAVGRLFKKINPIREAYNKEVERLCDSLSKRFLPSNCEENLLINQQMQSHFEVMRAEAKKKEIDGYMKIPGYVPDTSVK